MPFRVPLPGIRSLARSYSSISTPISTLPTSMAALASSNCERDRVRRYESAAAQVTGGNGLLFWRGSL